MRRGSGGPAEPGNSAATTNTSTITAGNGTGHGTGLAGYLRAVSALRPRVALVELRRAERARRELWASIACGAHPKLYPGDDARGEMHIEWRQADINVELARDNLAWWS